eukprot:TRINITY_DN2134_c0_g1_i6.p1 TRINITY_DN2134_c0_g1~~TRINITY_DN2134_c0_g1_i6.p1  ORF type:complete len:387 (-),score=60.09 TRINITY_DN2134_c0_g1_i6:99-1259(-)
MGRNAKRLSRNYGFLLFQFLLPSIQVILFCLAIGRDPQDLHMAVVNQDQGFGPRSNFGRSFLSQIDSSAIKQVNYNSMEEAVDSVKHGNAWGVISIPPTFSQYLFLRFSSQNVTDDIIAGSSIFLDLDMTNEQIYVMIQAQINTAFTAFLDQELNTLHNMGFPVNPNLAAPPIKLVDPPVYGSVHPKFTDFIAPGMIITIAFAQSIGLTALAFVLEKKEGTLDRCWSSGVRPSEVMVSHVVTQFFILLVQIGLLLFFALYIFSLPMNGNLGIVLLLTMLLGMSGMLYGLVISAICNKEQEAIQMSLGSFFPVMLLSGIIWPVEAIPTGLRYISMGLPTTWAANAMRSILNRGWSMEQHEVWSGFMVVIGWGVFFLILASRGLKSRD